MALTESAAWSCTGPQFSPDGKHVYCGFSPANQNVYNHDEIAQFRWRAGEPLGEPRLLTEGFDRSVSGFDLDDRGRTVYFTAADAGRSRIYELSTRNGDVRLLDADGRGVYAGVQAAGGNLLARWESGSVPAEIVRVGTKGGHESISGFNAWAMSSVSRGWGSDVARRVTCAVRLEKPSIGLRLPRGPTLPGSSPAFSI